nr:RHS repeat-associated core domain-containing protein [uncultured Methanoregula sp.]
MTMLKKHDHLNRLESIESQPSTDKRIAYTYRYNLANQRTNAVLADNTAWNYAYDDLGQLTSGVKVDPQSKPVDTAAYQYSYDTIGNRKSAVAGGIQVDYQVDALNRYTNAVAVARGGDGKTTDPSAISSRTGASQYDADGNLKSDGTWVYTWDAENRLIAMESGAGVSPANRKRLEFQYDSESRRIAKRVNTWTADRRPQTSGSWSLASDLRFVYDGWNLVAELQSNGSHLKSEISNLRSYLWGLDLSGSLQGAGGVGGLLAVVNPGNRAAVSFVSYDGNGNVVSLVDAASGTVSDRYEYDPFGNEIATAKTHQLINPFRFSTKFIDDETGLVYYGYRYYCPGEGKWLSRDPIEEQGGVNIYGFVYNAPTQNLDSDGREVVEKVVYESVSQTFTDVPPGEQYRNGTFNWKSKFVIKFDSEACKADIVLSLWTTVSADVWSLWSSAINQRWNGQFKLCCPGKCCGAEGNGITMTIVPEKKEGTTFNSAWYAMKSRNTTENMTTWSTSDVTDIPHEVGHMLGNKDEYYTVDGVAYGTAGSGTIMGSHLGAPQAKHYNMISKHLGDKCKVIGINETCTSTP